MKGNMISIRPYVVAMFLAVMLLLLPSAHAAPPLPTTGVVASVCQQLTDYTPTGGTAPVFPTGALQGPIGGQNGLIVISFAIMFVMFAIAALLFAIGYAFNLNSLKRFGRSEFGEIAITVVIIAVLVGSSSLVTALFNNTSAFYADCVAAGGVSLSLVPILVVYGVASNVVSLISSSQITVGTDFWGITVTPFLGYRVVEQQINLLTGIGSAIILLLLAVMVMLGIIYFLFPLFLYVGIVLRTIPFTRAAGGAFIALYIGFYLIFPLLLGVMLHYAPVVPVTVPSGTPICSGGITTCFFAPTSFTSTVQNIITLLAIPTSSAYYDVTSTFVTVVLAPSVYAVLSVLLSLYVSLEVVEIMSGLLGAPSLSSHETLRKLI